jgi:hypothetical protein
MTAAFVMALVLTSSLIVVQRGFQAIDTARYTTLAGQILQSQMEKLRLLTWSQLNSITATTFTPDVSNSSAQIANFTSCTQSISPDTSAPYNSTMINITLTANWRGADNRPHTLSYFTRYGQNGISDFFYTAH